MNQPAIGFDRVRWHRAAAGPGSAACALGFGSIVALGFTDGGYYDVTWHRAALALGAIAGIGLLLGRGTMPGRLELVSLSALAGLAALTLLSARWGIDGTEAVREAERCALYVVGLAALLVVVRPSTLRALLSGVVAGVVVLAVFGLVDRVTSNAALDPYQGSLLKEPVGYANALGLLMGLGVVLALGLRGDTRGIRRAALTAAAATCAAALVLTSSRGAWLSALAGLGVLAAMRCRRPRVVAAIAGTGVVLLLLTAPHVSLGDRPAYWNVALADASEHVVVGSGAGSFDDYWLEHRTIPAYVRDAHSSTWRPPQNSASSDSRSFCRRSVLRSSRQRAHGSGRSSQRPRAAIRHFSSTQGSTGTGRCPSRRSRASPAAPHCSSPRAQADPASVPSRTGPQDGADRRDRSLSGLRGGACGRPRVLDRRVTT